MSWAEYWASGWAVWLGAFCVLAIYSYLFRDNPVYRLMMQIFIGINVGYAVVVQWKDILYPLWWLPMMDGIDALLGRGQGSPYGALWVLVGLLGLLWYFQLSRRYLWLSRIVIGITVGIGAGFTFKSLFGQNIPQVVDSFRPLAPTAVAVQPRRLFPLPPSVVPPLLDEPLLVLAGDRDAVAVETLEGREVWRCRLPNRPTGRVRKQGDLVVIPCGSDTARIDRRTGQRVAGDASIPSDAPGQAGAEGGWHMGDDRDRLVKAAVAAPDGGEATVLYSVVDGRLSATRLNTNARDGFWASDPGVPAKELFDGGRFVLAADGRSVAVVDASVGSVTARFQSSAAPVWLSTARMSDPIHDQATVLAISSSGTIEGFCATEHKVSRQPAGASLWRTEAGGPLVWAGSAGGVLFAVGPDGGWSYELPVVPRALDASDYWDNWVFVVTLVSVMTYFFFSFRREPRAVTGVRRLGRWLLMLGFGAFFGNTVMSRMSFLLDRLMFLVDDWIKPFFHQVFG